MRLQDLLTSIPHVLWFTIGVGLLVRYHSRSPAAASIGVVGLCGLFAMIGLGRFWVIPLLNWLAGVLGDMSTAVIVTKLGAAVLDGACILLLVSAIVAKRRPIRAPAGDGD